MDGVAVVELLPPKKTKNALPLHIVLFPSFFFFINIFRDRMKIFCRIPQIYLVYLKFEPV